MAVKQRCNDPLYLVHPIDPVGGIFRLQRVCLLGGDYPETKAQVRLLSIVLDRGGQQVHGVVGDRLVILSGHSGIWDKRLSSTFDGVVCFN